MKRCLAWVLASVLAGCAVTPPAAPPPASVDVRHLQEWTARGRLALAARGEGGSGSFVWQQHGASTSLSIKGPLGTGAVQVVADGQSMSVTDGAGRSVDADAARELLKERLGADLPWTQLRYWLLGVPSPGEPAQVVDSGAAPLRVIEQSGWVVGYDSFRPVSGDALPARFTATSGAVRVKVIVDDWDVPLPQAGPP